MGGKGRGRARELGLLMSAEVQLQVRPSSTLTSTSPASRLFETDQISHFHRFCIALLPRSASSSQLPLSSDRPSSDASRSPFFAMLLAAKTVTKDTLAGRGYVLRAQLGLCGGSSSTIIISWFFLSFPFPFPFSLRETRSLARSVFLSFFLQRTMSEIEEPQR